MSKRNMRLFYYNQHFNKLPGTLRHEERNDLFQCNTTQYYKGSNNSCMWQWVIMLDQKAAFIWSCRSVDICFKKCKLSGYSSTSATSITSDMEKANGLFRIRFLRKRTPWCKNNPSHPNVEYFPRTGFFFLNSAYIIAWKVASTTN